jgi:hypothetical protein
MKEVIMENYEWIFSGIGVTVIGLFIKLLANKKKNSIIQAPILNNNIIINNGTNTTQEEKSSKNELKYLTRILFIDDDTKFEVVHILKTAGWVNTKRKKDIIDLDELEAKEADIIFVDINGVGNKLFPTDNGLGLAYALKQKYPNKKIVIYSAEQNGDRFHKAWNAVDARLSKNADPYEFINLIEGFSL